MAGMDMTEVSKIAETKPLAVVVFFEEPFWPIIQGLLQWQSSKGPLQVVVLCHTPEELLARSPQRLQRFIGLFLPGIRIELHPISTDSTPQEVREKIQAWGTEFPDFRWIFDTTGSAELISLGLAGLAGAPDAQTVCRGPSGVWLEYALAPDTSKIETRKLEGISPVALPSLTVPDLIRSQFNGPQDAIDFSCEPVGELPVKRLTQEGISRGWNWQASFSACGVKGELPVGALFEQYVGAGLREMGVDNLAFHVRLAHKRDRKETIEIDLLATLGNSVVALDLKMPKETEEMPGEGESLIAQLQKGIGIRQRLAGLAARIVFVRPGRLYSEAERELARVCGIEFMDQRDTPRLFSRLAAWLQIPALPREMAEVEALLVEQVAQRGRKLVLVGEGARTRLQEVDSGSAEWVDLDAYLNRLQVERGQNWILWATRNEIGLRLDRPANPPVELPDLIQAALSRFGRVRVDTLPNGYEAVFMRDNNRLAKLRQALAGFVNRRLETMVFVQVRSNNPAPVRPPVRPVKSGPALPVDYGTLNDLDAAVDQVFKPKPPRAS